MGIKEKHKQRGNLYMIDFTELKDTAINCNSSFVEVLR